MCVTFSHQLATKHVSLRCSWIESDREMLCHCQIGVIDSGVCTRKGGARLRWVWHASEPDVCLRQDSTRSELISSVVFTHLAPSLSLVIQSLNPQSGSFEHVLHDREIVHDAKHQRQHIRQTPAWIVGCISCILRRLLGEGGRNLCHRRTRSLNSRGKQVVCT